MNEIKSLLEEQSEAFRIFKERNDGRLERLEKHFKELDAKSNRPMAPGGAASSDLIEARKGVDSFLRTGDASALSAKSMSVTGGSPAGPDGGYAVPEEIASEIMSLMLPASPMRSVCNVVRATSGDYKQLVDVRGAAASWVGETAARPATDTPQLAEIVFPFGDLYANAFATQRLLDDASFDVAGWLIKSLAEQFARAENTAFTSGNGSDQPKGFLQYTQASTDDGTRDFGQIQYVPTGTAGAFKTASASVNPSDDLIVLVHKLKAGMRQGASWMMNSATLATIRQWKVYATGEPVWQPSMQAGQPSTLLGYPVIENEDMPDIGSGTVPIAFGNWKRAYTIVDRTQILIRDPYSNKPYVGFYSNRYTGGALVDSEAVKVLKLSAS